MKGTTTNVASLFNSSQNRQFYIEKKIGNAFVYLVHVRLWTYKNGDRKTYFNIGIQNGVFPQHWKSFLRNRVLAILNYISNDNRSYNPIRLFDIIWNTTYFCLIENIKSIVFIDLNIRKICRYKNWLEVTSPWNDDYKC